MSDQFVHLHVHTEYSMLDGAARVSDLFASAAEMGMPALACTDHGNMYGAFDFYKAGKAAGVKPIIGIEAYVAPGSRFDRTKLGFDSNKVDKYSHMTLLASSDQGYANLVKLASLASLEGYYYKPRVDRELLSQYADGLIATSGCLGSEVNQLLLRGDYAGAKQTLSDYADIFGRDDYYVEVMDHGIADQERTTPDLIKLARELGLPLLATNDLHYTKKEDSVAHEVLLCVQTGSTIADPGRFKLETPEFYLKSPAEMRALWRDYPEACDNTLLIAERCELTIEEGKDLLPRFPVPDGTTEESWLRAEVERGMRKRWGDDPTPEQRAQIDYELGVINQMGFPSY
ncbi:MAG TPA: PHP domain-containing protein, partial [Mycobacteriales bacterium]|nr:PHP domain-containing protein [Mycobacteriales bacterium]